MEANVPEVDMVDANQSGQPDPPNSPAPSNLFVQPDEPEDVGEPEVRDPNDLYRDDVKRYNSGTLIILDAPEAEPIFKHEQNETTHKHNCHLIEITFRAISNMQIEKICLPQNATAAEFWAAINALLADKTESDMLIWHYHGSAGGTEVDYKW